MTITDKDLDTLALRINELQGTPLQPYADGKPQANCYHVQQAYGGVNLARMSSVSGSSGTSNIFAIGYTTKRDLYNRMQAYICGIEAGKGSAS